MAVRATTDLDFGVILESLLLNPESYVNFGAYWWPLKRMLADWGDENGADVDTQLLRGSEPLDGTDLDDGDVYRFLDGFSCREDFITWISFVNPMTVWDESSQDEVMLEDIEWEENFL